MFKPYHRVWLSLLTISPAVITAILIVTHWTDIPLWDEWAIVDHHQKFAEGTLGFADLMRLQNEYRQFFPNIIFVAVGWLTRGDVRWLMVLSFLSACLISYTVYHLARLTIPLGPRPRMLLLFLSNLLIFSPVQYENWIQGQQLIYFIPVLCLTSALLICFSNLRPFAKLLICAALATVATFSSANGILCWIVIFPVLVGDKQIDGPKRKWLTVCWLFGLCLNLALYLYDYHIPPGPPLSSVLTHPIDGALYFLVVVGRPLSAGPEVIHAAMGLLLLGLFAAMTWYAFKSRNGAVRNRQSMCWLMLGSYSVLTAAIITIGRAGFGLANARGAARYTTFTLYLIVALLHLIVIWFYSNDGNWARQRLSDARMLRVLVVSFVLIHIPLYLFGVRQFNNYRMLVLHTKAYVLLSNVVTENDRNHLYYTDSRNEKFNVADKLGMVHPRMLRVEDFRNAQSIVHPEVGSFERFEKTGENSYTASGWAVLPGRNEPADAILIMYERTGEPPIIIGRYPLNVNRDFISKLLQRSFYVSPQWSQSVTGPSRAGETTVSAWVIDAYSGKLYKLVGTHVLN